MAAFLTEEAKSALTAAIVAVEARSSAELVIAVRRASGSYAHADLLAGSLAGVAALACLLYLPVDFGLHAFLVDPVAFGLIAMLVCSRLPMLRRLLSTAARREAQVREAARATFYQKGVRHTRAAIGILIYVSLLERRVEVVADRGILEAVPARDWKAATAAIADRVRAGADGVEVAAAIVGLAEVLEPHLPRAADDVNELPDEVHA